MQELDEARALQLAESYFYVPTKNPEQLKLGKARKALSQIHAEELAESSFSNKAHASKETDLSHHGLAIAIPRDAMMLASSSRQLTMGNRASVIQSESKGTDKEVSMEAAKLVNRAFDSAAIDLSGLKSSEMNVRSAALARIQAKHHSDQIRSQSKVKQGIRSDSESSISHHQKSKSKSMRDDSLKELLALMQPPPLTGMTHDTKVTKDLRTARKEMNGVDLKDLSFKLQPPHHDQVSKGIKEKATAPKAMKEGITNAPTTALQHPLNPGMRKHEVQKQDSLKELLSLMQPAHDLGSSKEEKQSSKAKGTRTTASNAKHDESMKQQLSAMTLDKSSDKKPTSATTHSRLHHEKYSSHPDVSAIFKQALHRKSLIDFNAFRDRQERSGNRAAGKNTKTNSLHSLPAAGASLASYSEKGSLSKEDTGMFDEAFVDAFVPADEAEGKTMWDN
eukprot:764714-Hanusia_phi.AAC.3